MLARPRQRHWAAMPMLGFSCSHAAMRLPLMGPAAFCASETIGNLKKCEGWCDAALSAVQPISFVTSAGCGSETKPFRSMGPSGESAHLLTLLFYLANTSQLAMCMLSSLGLLPSNWPGSTAACHSCNTCTAIDATAIIELLYLCLDIGLLRVFNSQKLVELQLRICFLGPAQCYKIGKRDIHGDWDESTFQVEKSVSHQQTHANPVHVACPRSQIQFSPGFAAFTDDFAGVLFLCSLLVCRV